MKTSRSLFLLLLRTRPRGERGFGLLLALLVALVTVISAVTLVSRTQSGWLGTAEQSESRLARDAAEAGLTRVIAELNLPVNRRLLVSPMPFTDWKTRAAAPSNSSAYMSVTNPCLNPSGTTGNTPAPSDALQRMADQSVATATTQLDSPTPGLQRRFLLRGVRLSDRGRSHWYRSTRPGGDGAAIGDQGGFTQDLINFSHTNNVGAIELVVQGQVLKGGRVVATANLSREYVVVPKCCQRTFGGPAQMFGNDFRWCNGLDMAGYPPLVLGLKNTANDLSGGVYVLTNTTPELRLRTDPSEPPPRILCYVPTGTATGTCGGRQELDGVPVLPTSLSFPSLPHLGSSGLPCKTNDTACLASTPPSTAFSIELFNRNNGASENSATEIYAKDYLRVRKGAVEICNKKYSATGAKAATIADYDRTPEIVPDSCQDLSDYCVQQVTDGYATYHCRVKNIYVNDFGADGDMQVRQNNTLFIDTSNGPIYLYIYDQWAKKSVLPGDPVLEQMGTFNYNLDFPPSNFAPIYTVGGYNDGQIQHVQCEPYTDVGTACVDESKASSAMTRAEIISDLANTATNLSDYTALIGDDGFVRDVFFWMPKASFHLAGDPNLVDTGGDAPQGKPQLSAGLWLNTLRFTRRTSELYLPSAVDQFFPFLLTPNDRLVAIVYDWVARSSTITSLFQQAP